MQRLKRVVLQVLVLVQWIVNLVVLIFDKKEEKKRIPHIEDPLLNLSATKLAEKIRRIEISSEVLVSAYIKRIEQVNPIINAVVENRFKEALSEAKKVDDSLRHHNTSNLDLEKIKPLLGVPITVKECLAVKGMSFTGCSLTRKGMKAEKDAETVALLKEAGAIILLVSSTPEFCTTIETNNKIVGKAKNPYDTTRVCGGSSGGEGGLLGAGASIIGIGTDIAGSIRIPCAFNGIYGHKPTSGAIPLGGSFPWCDDKRFAEYLSVGPMSRYPEDLKLTLKVLAGSKAPQLRLDEQVDLKQVKLFYMLDSGKEFGLLKVDKQIKSAIKQGVTYLNKSFRCQVDETKFPEMGSSMEMTGLIFAIENLPNVFTYSDVKYSAKSEFLKFLLGRSIFCFQSFVFAALEATRASMSDHDFHLYSKKLKDFKEKFANTLGENGVFLYPNFPTEAFEHHGFIKGMLGGRLPAIFNLLGFPVTCVPIGLSKNGLPLGIQVVAGPYCDNLTIEVAKELRKYFGGWRCPS